MNYKKLFLVSQKVAFSLSLFSGSFLFLTGLLVAMSLLSHDPSSLLAQVTSTVTNTTYSTTNVINTDDIELSNLPEIISIDPVLDTDYDPTTSSGLPTTETTVSTDNNNNIVVNPEIKIVNDTPAITRENFIIKLETLAITRVSARVISLNGTFEQNIAGSKVDDNHFVINIPASQYPYGKYAISVIGTNGDGIIKKLDNIFFFVPEPVLSNTLPSIPNTFDETIATITPAVTSDVKATTTLTLPTTVSFSAKMILPSIKPYQGKVPVSITTTKEAKAIDLYLIDTNSQRQHIGSARKESLLGWFFVIDTTQINNGIYRLGAKAALDDTEYEVTRIEFPVYNPPLIKIIQEIKDTGDDTTQERLEAFVPERVVLTTSLIDRDESSDTLKSDTDNQETENTEENKSYNLKPDLNAITAKVLKEKMMSINAQIKIYTDTIQKTGTTSTPGFEQAKVAIMSDILRDRGLISISPEAKDRIELEITRLITRAEKIELALYAERNQLIKPEELIEALTTEIETYPTEDSLIDYTSPKEFGLVREDILTVESVKPVLTTNFTDNSTSTQAEIRGKALPNSIVTIYIYSNPVVVTVKADEEGNFVYVYDKELEDGEHEVYVAITAKSGSVVVKSEGFGFIKEAQAFTINDEPTTSSIVVSPNENSPLTNPYLIVLAMSVMAFSVTLLLLSRRLDPELIADNT